MVKDDEKNDDQATFRVLENNHDVRFKHKEDSNSIYNYQPSYMSQSSVLRQDLIKIKQQQLEVNLKKQLENQRKLLAKNDIGEAEQYDLKCFAPI